MGWGPLNGRPGLRMAVWSQVGVRGRGLSLRHRLYALSACDTTAPLLLLLPLVALYKYYTITF